MHAHMAPMGPRTRPADRPFGKNTENTENTESYKAKHRKWGILDRNKQGKHRKCTLEPLSTLCNYLDMHAYIAPIGPRTRPADRPFSQNTENAENTENKNENTESEEF